MSDDNNEPPADSKLTKTKRRWAEARKFITGKTSRADTERLPPGQHLTKDWPVLDLGQTPNVPLHHWRLDVTGAVEHPLSLDWQQFLQLPQSREVTDIHCVTTWSRYDNEWQGVFTHDLLDAAMPKPETTHVMLSSYDGYTTTYRSTTSLRRTRCWFIRGRANRSRANTAARCGLSFRTSISGRARSGSRRSTS